MIERAQIVERLLRINALNGAPDRSRESFGIAGFRPTSADDLYPTLVKALAVDGPAVVEVPIDYRENLKLTEHLGSLAVMA